MFTSYGWRFFSAFVRCATRAVNIATSRQFAFFFVWSLPTLFRHVSLVTCMTIHDVPSSIGLTCQGPVSCYYALVSPWWHASTGSAGCHSEAGRLGHGISKAPPPRRLEQPPLGQPLFLGQPLLEQLRQHGVAVVSGLTPLLCILWSCTTIALWLESCVVVFWFAKCVSESQGLSRNMVAHDSSAWTGIGCTLSVGRNCSCPSGSCTPRVKRAPGWRA